jgi:hypothetical protein
MFKTLLLVAVLLTTGYSMQYSYQSSLKASINMQDEALIGGVLEALIHNAVSYNGNYAMPLGVNVDGYHQLPTSLGSSRVSMNGTPFVYCPFSSALANEVDSEVSIGGGGSYPVSVLNNSVTKGRDFVYGVESIPASKLLAVVIKPNVRENIPDCYDVALNSEGKYVLTGESEGMGRPYVITTDDMVYDDVVKVYDAHNSESLNEALEAVERNPEGDHIILITTIVGYRYIINRGYTFDSKSHGGSLTIRAEVDDLGFVTGEDWKKVEIRPLEGNGNYIFPLKFINMHVTVQNLWFNGGFFLETYDSIVNMKNAAIYDLSFYNSSVSLEDVYAYSGIHSYRSKILMAGENQFHNNMSAGGVSDESVWFEDSEITSAESTLKIVVHGEGVGVTMINSKLTLRQSDVIFVAFEANGSTPSAMFHIDPASTLVTSDVNVLNPNVAYAPESGSKFKYGIVNLGRFVAENFNMSLYEVSDVGMYSSKGSFNRFGNVKLGNSSDSESAYQAVFGDADAQFLGNVDIESTACFSGDGFENNISLSVQDDFVERVNPDLSVVSSSVEKELQVDASYYFNDLTVTCN